MHKRVEKCKKWEKEKDKVNASKPDNDKAKWPPETYHQN